MRYTLEIQKILYQVEENSSLTPRDKVRMLRQAAYIADENDDVSWEYDVRKKLLDYSCYLPYSTDVINDFTWIVNAYEEYPELIEESDFLWEYKWVARRMYFNAQVRMEQLNAVMEDFRMRLERNGFSLRAYYERLMDEKVVIGDLEEATHYLQLRNAEAEDAMANCPACTLDYEITYQLALGKLDEALRLAHPFLNRQLEGCRYVPMNTFCKMLPVAWKEGRRELAAQLYERTEEDIDTLLKENDESLMRYLSKMIYYLLQTDSPKAWSYIEKCIPWFLESDDYPRYEYAAFLLEGLQGKVYTGPVALSLPPEFACYNKEGLYDVEELAAWLKKEGMEVAQAFDRRNGCTTFTDRIRAASV